MIHNCQTILQKSIKPVDWIGGPKPEIIKHGKHRHRTVRPDLVIIQWLRNHPGSLMSEICAGAKVIKSTAQLTIKQQVAKGYIVVTPSGRFTSNRRSINAFRVADDCLIGLARGYLQ